ncbi:MAG: TonB-dependent receptor [Edaphobacter sp.]|uniref:TonB-dependent receptor n=1 Tax=Edaphobacter sp. TaxID=1934404 RepID=UPI00238D4D26|nr:TonB-dependent receptor [Edaphobacter sp.]MDE1176654.1 TonB-dependent receptor [Edaphobacter sp.]
MNYPPACKRILTVAAAAVLSLVVSLPATAQTAATGTISGTITDASGAVVPNAVIQVINTDTGATRNLTAGTGGEYSSTFLQPGHYELIVAGTGFGKVDRKNLNLTVGQVLSVDLALPAASTSTEVTVTDASPLIDTEKTQVSQTIGQELVSNLPVNGRRYDNFVLLTTNVVPDGSSGLISYRGISGLYNTNLIDGANNQQAFFSEARGRAIGAPYVFSVDSIKEFESSVSGYSAEFGQAAGGQINAISRNGTNTVHGDLFYSLRYPSLNALDPLTKYQGRTNKNPFLLQPAIHQQQQFGGSVGGPIIKDKLFYFFTYDGFRRVQPLLYSSLISSATLAGYACPSPITSTQCDAAKAYINGLSGPAPRTLKQDIFFPRIDWQANGNNHVSAEFNWQNYNLPNGYTTSATATNSSASTNGRADFHERFFISNWESVLTPSMTNALRFQWARDLEVTSANAPGPSVTISGLQGYGMPNALPRGAFPDEHRIQIADTLSKVMGRHTVKVGVDVNLIHDYLANLFQGGGVYSYAALTGQCATGVQAAGCTTISGVPAAFANWVQDVYGVNGGRHWTSFQQVNDPITHIGADDMWNKDVAAFAEDSWKVSNNLTVTAGLRYDLQLVPQPPVPYTNSYNGAASPLGNYYTKTIHTNYTMLQPRVGFAWSPFDGMVVRGGYGIFYGLSSNSTFYATRVENGVFQQAYSLAASTATTNGVTNYSYPTGAPQNIGVLFTPPGLPLAAPFAGAVTPTVNGSAGLQKLSFRGQDPGFTNPYTHSMDLGIEQQLPGHISLSISYVGTRGMRLPYFIDANLPHTNLTRTYTVTNTAGVAQSTVTVPFYSNTLSRPSPNDGGILVGFSGINSWYHSAAISIRKPMSHQLEALINFTWAKTIDGSQVSGQYGTFNGTNTILDPYNLKNPGTLSEYGRSDLDMRGRFVGSLVWQPVVGVANPFLRYAVNGWSLSGSATEQTGLPVTAMMSSSAVTGGIEGGVTGGAVGNSPSPATGRAPQVSRNSFPGPGIRNIDTRLSRKFTIHEGVNLQLSAEAFNVVNKKQIISVSTTAYQYNGATTIAPYTSTPFGTPTSTSGTLYGPRQLQFTARLNF